MKKQMSFLIIFFSFSACNDGDIFSKSHIVPPQIIYSYPDIRNSKGFKINSSILITFDTDMDESSFSGENFSLKCADDSIVSCTYEKYGSRSILMHPSVASKDLDSSESLLSPNTSYKLFISKGVRDCKGNTMESDFSVSFETGEYLDTTSPKIKEDLFTISNNIIKIYFDEPLNPRSIDSAVEKSLISLVDENQGNLAYNFYYVSGEKALFIEPDVQLADNISYTLTIEENSVSDLASNYFSASQTFKFKNGEPEEDIVSPEIVSVASAFALVIEFNEDIDSTSVVLNGDNPTIILPDEFNGSNTASYTCSAGFNNGTKKIIIVPDEAEFNETFYGFRGKLTITTGVTDLAGNPVKEEALYILGDYVINSKEDLDDILNCRAVIDGGLSIYADDVTDLNQLENLESCDSIKISSCNLLGDISGLRNLVELNDLHINGNPLLESLAGLENIKQLHSLKIYNNGSLTSLQGLNNLEYISSELAIDTETELLSLSALSKVHSGSEMSLSLSGLSKLNSLEGLENITSVYHLEIRSSVLENLDGLSNLTEVSQSLTLYENNNLLNIDGLDNVVNCGNIRITYNDLLESISFSSVQTAKSVYIGYNPELTLLGFDSLESISYLSVRSNVTLPNSVIKAALIDDVDNSGSSSISGNLVDITL